MKIKKGDTVKILYGKDSGKQGSVVGINADKNNIVVEGLNVFKRHVKGDGRTKVSEILNIVKPLSVSKVMLVCPNCNKTTRVALRREDGKVVRICKKCNKIIETNTKKEEIKEVVRKTSKKISKKK